MTQAEASELLDCTAAQLGEHFTAVQIHVSMPGEGGGTHGCHRGSGDWYARQGLAHEFIEQDKAQEVGQSVARAIENE